MAFLAGVYFRDDVVKFYNNFNNQVKKINTGNIGSVINQASKELFTPPPLLVYKKPNSVILLQSKIILETNLQRQQNGGLPALKENNLLNKVALAKANDMFSKQYFEHISPLGVGPGELAQKYGYEYIIEGENLILGNFSSEKEVVQAWMDSPGHRENILNNRYTEIGVAVIKGIYNGETVWIGVQEFGLPLSACNEPDISIKKQIDLNNLQLNNLVAQLDKDRQQINDTDPNSEIYEQMVNDYNKLVAEYNLLADNTKSLVATYNKSVNNFNNCVSGTR